MSRSSEQLLRGLAAGDERSLSGVMGATPAALDRRTRTLVQLAALLALGASTTSLQLAVESAAVNGVGVATLAGVLFASAPTAGTVRVVEEAPRLALALGFELELDGSDGS